MPCNTVGAACDFRCFEFGVCFGFRASIFEIPRGGKLWKTLMFLLKSSRLEVPVAAPEPQGDELPPTAITLNAPHSPLAQAACVAADASGRAARASGLSHRTVQTQCWGHHPARCGSERGSSKKQQLEEADV